MEGEKGTRGGGRSRPRAKNVFRAVECVAVGRCPMVPCALQTTCLRECRTRPYIVGTLLVSEHFGRAECLTSGQKRTIEELLMHYSEKQLAYSGVLPRPIIRLDPNRLILEPAACVLKAKLNQMSPPPRQPHMLYSSSYRLRFFRPDAVAA